MKKYLIGIAAGVALCIAGCAFAAGDTFARNGTGYVGVEGGYGFLNTPEASYPKDFGTYPFYEDVSNYATTTEKGEAVWGFHAGYDFKISRVWALGIEIGYKDLGESKYTSTWTDYENYQEVYQLVEFNGSRKINQSAFDLLLTARAFVWKGLDFFAKGGMAYVGSTTDQDLTYQVMAGGTIHNLQPWDGKSTIWRIRPEVAIGAGYLFTPHFHVYLAYDYIAGANNGDDSENNMNEAAGAAMPPRAKVYDFNAGFVGAEYRF